MTRARLPDLGSRVPRSGGVLTQAIGSLALRLLRWRIDGAIPDVPKAIIIVAPHTSNWDFPVGLAAKWTLRLSANFLGKDSLFRFPLGGIMRAVGGIPVDRSSPHDVVNSIVEEFRRREHLFLAIAPEGTRKLVERWRTGFYHIAHGAGVPIVPVALDFGQRAVVIQPPFQTTGDADADIAELQRRFLSARGRNPGQTLAARGETATTSDE